MTSVLSLNTSQERRKAQISSGWPALFTILMSSTSSLIRCTRRRRTWKSRVLTYSFTRMKSILELAKLFSQRMTRLSSRRPTGSTSPRPTSITIWQTSSWRPSSRARSTASPTKSTPNPCLMGPKAATMSSTISSSWSSGTSRTRVSKSPKSSKPST